MGLLIAGVAIAAVAAVASAGATYAAYNQQAQAADYNKKVARHQAMAARDAASIARANREEELRHILAAQRARIGASGVTEEGSPLLVEMKSAEQAQLDLARITYAGATRQQAYTSEAILQGFYSKSAQQAGYIGTGTALLGGAANTTSIYSAGQKPKSGSGANAP